MNQKNFGNALLKDLQFSLSYFMKYFLPFWLCGTVQGAEKAHPFLLLLLPFILNILILTRITWAIASRLVHNSMKLMLSARQKSRRKVFDDGKTWESGLLACQLNNKPSLISLALKSHFVYFSYLHKSKGFQFLNSVCQIVGCPA